jgi:NhaA family Na+:H+ antiporter
MAIPALIYLSMNAGRSSVSGWAVPMATDIAFAVGALALLGKRVSPSLRILLLALAVIDDVGALVVIALFSSTGVNAMGFGILALGVVAIIVMQFLGVRTPVAYIVPATVVWAGAYSGGVHPTLAGVVVGFMTPVRAWYGPGTFLHQTEERAKSLRSGKVPDDRELLPHLDTFKTAAREAVSPVERLQHMLHGWVAFGIMPIFALANAGVPLGDISFEGDAWWVFWGVTLGLFAGKPLGVFLVSRLSAAAGAAALPQGVRWPHISVVGMVAGIGFTMALFIAQLAFPAGPLLETAKLAILCGSGLAGIVALAAGYRLLQPQSSTNQK